MKQLSIDPQRLAGNDQKMPSVKPATNSAPQQKPVSLQLIQAVDRLLKFYPPLDVGDPEMFIAGIASIFAQYPPELVEIAIDPAKGIPSLLRSRDLSELANIKRACDKLYEPIEDRIERERASKSHRLALPAPSEPVTDESRARVAAMLAEAKEVLGPPLRKDHRAKGPIAFEMNGKLTLRPKDMDGKHASRIADDLEKRRARNAAMERSHD